MKKSINPSEIWAPRERNSPSSLCGRDVRDTATITKDVSVSVCVCAEEKGRSVPLSVLRGSVMQHARPFKKRRIWLVWRKHVTEPPPQHEARFPDQQVLLVCHFVSSQLHLLLFVEFCSLFCSVVKLTHLSIYTRLFPCLAVTGCIVMLGVRFLYSAPVFIPVGHLGYLLFFM